MAAGWPLGVFHSLVLCGVASGRYVIGLGVPTQPPPTQLGPAHHHLLLTASFLNHIHNEDLSYRGSKAKAAIVLRERHF